MTDDELPGGSFVAKIYFVVGHQEGIIDGCRIGTGKELARDGAEDVGVRKPVGHDFSVV